MNSESQFALADSDLLKPWEQENSFHDTLYEWMSRAPWLAISAAAHALVFLVLLAIPWELLYSVPETVLITTLEQQPPDVFEDPPPEELEPEPPELPEEPVPMDDALPVDEADLAREDDAPPEGEPEFLAESPFTSLDINGEIGIGGAAGGKYGDRFGTGNGSPRGGSGTEPAVVDALRWLVAHQSPDGSWDCDGFAARCGKVGSGTCEGAGRDAHDVGVTGLALLALLGKGNTTREGEHRQAVTLGIRWLKEAQDPDTGLIGERIGKAFLYDHALATLALCEAYYFSGSPLLERPAQDAVNYISTARNPYGAWRYDVPPSGDNDTSVTGWMVLALKSAEDAGLRVDPDAFTGALSWLDEVTDPATGRCGYDSIGGLSSRMERVNDHFPPEKGEAMTAVALLSRFFLGQTPEDEPLMERHAQVLRRKLPEWDPDGYGCDMYYWYYGSYAMFQMGGSENWTPWNRAMKLAILSSQRRDGDAKGSWDPVGPWGQFGGRVYSTALMTLCLEVYFRYGRGLGMR